VKSLSKDPWITCIIRKSCTPMILKKDYMNFNFEMLFGLVKNGFILMKLLLNDFCAMLKCFICSFIDIRTQVNNCWLGVLKLECLYYI